MSYNSCMQIFHRLFFAFIPPVSVAEGMTELLTTSGWPGKPNRTDRLHMTLALTPDFTDMPREAIDAFIKIGGEVAAEPLRLILDRAIAREKNLVLVPSERLPQAERFQRQLVRAIARARLPLRKSVRFSPHITLSYQKGVAFDRPINSFSWLAEEFVLIHSHVGLTRHDVVGRWRLTGNRNAAGGDNLFAQL